MGKQRLVRVKAGESLALTIATSPGMAYMARATLRASLSGTFLQILPDLVTPLKGASLISAQLSTDAVSKVRILI